MSCNFNLCVEFRLCVPTLHAPVSILELKCVSWTINLRLGLYIVSYGWDPEIRDPLCVLRFLYISRPKTASWVRACVSGFRSRLELATLSLNPRPGFGLESLGFNQRSAARITTRIRVTYKDSNLLPRNRISCFRVSDLRLP